MKTVLAPPAPLGLIQTGGGCTAWETYLGGDQILLVTDADDGVAPAEDSRALLAGLYRDGSSEPHETHELASVDELEKWLRTAPIWACDWCGATGLDADELADCRARDRA